MDAVFAPGVIAVIQFLGLAVLLTMVLVSVKRSRSVFYRPIFWVIVGWVIVYLLPSIFYGGNLVAGLPNSSYFLIILNATPIALVFWLVLSEPGSKARGGEVFHQRNIESFSIVAMGLVVLVIVGVWMYQIPFQCSAGWALIFDPERMLLAREVAAKLSNKSNTWRLIGVYVNVVAPFLVFMCGVKLVEYVNGSWMRNMHKIIVLMLLAIVSYSVIFLTGTKGSLFVFFIASTVTMGVMSIGWRSKFTAIACVGLLGLASVFFLQLVTASERLVHSYPFGACVAGFDACQEGAELIVSATARNQVGILGSSDDAQSIVESFEEACHVQVTAQVIGLGVSGGVSSSGVPIEEHLRGLWERAFAVPLQVASWYNLYASEHNQFDINSIPVISRINNGPSAAKEVYQQYGVFYSKGDITSTSTAPTSFLIAYPALMGSTGLLVALALLVVFDGVATLMLRQVRGSLLYGFAGLSAVVAYHFLNGDFFTVLGSHGGLAFLILVFVFAAFHRRDRIALSTNGGGQCPSPESADH